MERWLFPKKWAQITPLPFKPLSSVPFLPFLPPPPFQPLPRIPGFTHQHRNIAGRDDVCTLVGADAVWDAVFIRWFRGGTLYSKGTLLHFLLSRRSRMDLATAENPIATSIQLWVRCMSQAHVGSGRTPTAATARLTRVLQKMDGPCGRTASPWAAGTAQTAHEHHRARAARRA